VVLCLPANISPFAALNHSPSSISGISPVSLVAVAILPNHALAIMLDSRLLGINSVCYDMSMVTETERRVRVKARSAYLGAIMAIEKSSCWLCGLGDVQLVKTSIFEGALTTNSFSIPDNHYGVTASIYHDRARRCELRIPGAKAIQE
jgi:hypothetical protein